METLSATILAKTEQPLSAQTWSELLIREILEQAAANFDTEKNDKIEITMKFLVSAHIHPETNIQCVVVCVGDDHGNKICGCF